MIEVGQTRQLKQLGHWFTVGSDFQNIGTKLQCVDF